MAGRESIFAVISLYFGRVDGVELIAGKKREGGRGKLGKLLEESFLEETGRPSLGGAN